MSSPTQRTLKLLKEKGYKAAIVERWLQYAGSFGKRQDMFGIIDVLAITPDITLGIQCCSGSAVGHYQKITKEKNQEAYDWLSNPGRSLEIWAWRKLKKKLKKPKKGKKKKKAKAFTWQPKIIKITLENLEI